MGNIPVGTTEGTVVQHQLGKSPKSGSQRIEVLFEDDQGNRSWWHGYLHTDKTFGRTVEALEFLGWDADACQGRSRPCRRAVPMSPKPASHRQSGRNDSLLRWRAGLS